MKHFWLRAETKPGERRRILSPGDCHKLLDAGFRITVEECSQSIFKADEYKKVGCELTGSGTWTQAPDETVILGLKEIEETSGPLKHDHVYFSHSYKGQQDADELLARFKSDGGRIFDLEFLVDENKRRVAAFGFWAGYVGAGLGLYYLNNRKIFPQVDNKSEFLEVIGKHTNLKGMVIGALGRSGSGAVEVLEHCGVATTSWDFEETKGGGPFQEILDHDLFVNCVLSMKPIPPFLTTEMLKAKSSLKIITDVSCDPGGPCNTLPIYDECTTLKSPLVHVGPSTEMIAIDHLPTVLPRESSEEFSGLLLPHLLNFGEEKSPWSGALELFHQFAKV